MGDTEHSVRSILIYTDGEVIGDGILRLAFAAAIKRAVPDARITWLASGYSVYNTVLREMAAPIIDELMILPNRRIPLMEYLRRPAVLRDRQFDLILDTQRNVKRTVWLKRIHHRRFISAAADGFFSSEKLPDLSPHFLKRLLQLGELGLGTPLTLAPLALPSPEWDEHAAALLPDGARYIGLILGAGHPDKCWPLEKFVALAREIYDNKGMPVLFLGPQEQALAEQLRLELPFALQPLSGGASPYLTIALGHRLSAAVANDSGGGHLLAAADTPLVSLFRSASVRSKFLPMSNRIIALAPEDFGVPSMREIPLEAVSQALSDLL